MMIFAQETLHQGKRQKEAARWSYIGRRNENGGSLPGLSFWVFGVCHSFYAIQDSRERLSNGRQES